VTITFAGSEKHGDLVFHINGSTDRVTGDVEARYLLFDEKTNKPLSTTAYALECRPTQHMF
jgi:hypothetical protein